MEFHTDSLDFPDVVGALVVVKGVPPDFSRFFHSFFFKFMLNELIYVLNGQNIAFFHPFIDLEVSGALDFWGFLAVAFFKYYHYLVGHTCIIISINIDFTKILTALHLPPVPSQLGLCVHCRIH